MKIICAGLMVCDMIAKPIDRKIFSYDSIRLDSFQIATGGDALNVALNLSKLKINVMMVGRVGNDINGNFLIEALEKHGVDPTNVIRTSQLNTAVSIAMVDSAGERRFAYFGGANDSFDERDVSDDLLKKAKILFIGSAFGMHGLEAENLENLCRRAKENGLEVILDVTSNPSARQMVTIKKVLPYVDVFIPSQDEAASLTGVSEIPEAAEKFSELGGKTIVIKAGAAGCYVRDGVDKGYISAVKTNVIDTTGAGDAFVSGYIYGLTKSFSAFECARLGTIMGARCVSGLGATESTPYEDDLMKTYNRNLAVP